MCDEVALLTLMISLLVFVFDCDSVEVDAAVVVQDQVVARNAQHQSSAEVLDVACIHFPKKIILYIIFSSVVLSSSSCV